MKSSRGGLFRSAAICKMAISIWEKNTGTYVMSSLSLFFFFLYFSRLWFWQVVAEERQFICTYNEIAWGGFNLYICMKEEEEEDEEDEEEDDEEEEA